MGTNFYIKQTCSSPCEHCLTEELHIGKRSYGWTFGFEKHTYLGLDSWEAWKDYLAKTEDSIVNEYGEEFSLEEFVELVEETRLPYGPDKREPARRDGWSKVFQEYDDRHSRDEDGWDFWDGEFS